MRWEYTSPVVEVKDRQANFELYSGKLLLAGRDGNSRALYDPFYKGFEPRIGLHGRRAGSTTNSSFAPAMALRSIWKEPAPICACR